MPTSITKYQIPSGNNTPPPPLAPDLPILTPSSIGKNIVNPANHPDPPSNLSNQTLVHAQLLDASAQTHSSQFHPSISVKTLLPNLFDRLKENPLTAPIASDVNSPSTSTWKTHIGIGIASFFLGASIAIILMLYLY